MTFRVLMTCGAFEPGYRAGGPIRSAAHIVDTAPDDIDLQVVTRDRDLGASRPYAGLSGARVWRGRAQVHYLNLARPRHWLRLWRQLRRTRFDLMYCNSFWNVPFTVVPVFAARLRLIRVAHILLAPRGELLPGALAHKARKKDLFRGGWGRFLAGTGVTWHASADDEADRIRAMFPHAAVLVNDDQTALPHQPLPAQPPADEPRLVYLGRLSPNKNLDLTIRGLSRLDVPVRFDIYGPVDDAAYWAHCRSLIDRLPSMVECQYHGPVEPHQVRTVFAGYDAFVLPTRGENFGHVIVESLSASCPVICSAHTPWTEVLRGGGGVVLPELTVECLAEHLGELARATPAQRHAAKWRAGGAYEAWCGHRLSTNILAQTKSLIVGGHR
jgi:glycosyltransferase involved in cell wall biosynthesis